MFRQREEQAQRPHRRTKLGGLENPKRRVSLAPSECGEGREPWPAGPAGGGQSVESGGATEMKTFE